MAIIAHSLRPRSSLTAAHLRKAHLRKAHLRKAHLRKAHLRKAHLRKANFSGSSPGSTLPLSRPRVGQILAPPPLRWDSTQHSRCPG
ncbi:MAG: pentapeptide repeat-containing protein, partial [Planctomycetales bacterium]|nr:pentapeptide repeat-containing protein [Planctomycetales bacterium]